METFKQKLKELEGLMVKARDKRAHYDQVINLLIQQKKNVMKEMAIERQRQEQEELKERQFQEAMEELQRAEYTARCRDYLGVQEVERLRLLPREIMERAHAKHFLRLLAELLKEEVTQTLEEVLGQHTLQGISLGQGWYLSNSIATVFLTNRVYFSLDTVSLEASGLLHRE